MNRNALCLVLAFSWSGLCFAQAKPVPTPVAAPQTTATVTISGPLALQLAPAIDPQVLKKLEEHAARIDGRLGRLEKGQAETNRKVDLLLKKVDQLLAQKKEAKTDPVKAEIERIKRKEQAVQDPVEEEKKLAKKEGFIRHVCKDGKEHCFWRPSRCEAVQVYDFGMEQWCRIERFTGGGGDGWYVLRGNTYRFFLPVAETQPILDKLAWID